MANSNVKLPVLPEELECFAEEELIDIVPNFTLDEPDNTFRCIGGDYGPIVAAIPARVPIWMALQLHRRGKCTVLPPEWLRPDVLKRLTEAEQTDGSTFQPLPFHYVEIACLLFNGARGAFGSDFSATRDALQRLVNIRRHKTEEGMRGVSDAQTVKMVGLAAAEANAIRLNLTGAFNALAKMDEAVRDVGPVGSLGTYTATGTGGGGGSGY